MVAGDATFQQNGSALNIDTFTDRTIIDWQSFNIGNGESVSINQPNVTSATLNRVVGNTSTNIIGSLISNGKVAVINPNGVLIDQNGVIDTHGFIASTLDISDQSFLSGDQLLFSGSSENGVVNQGTILARQGDVFLLGKTVENAGDISAEDGSIGLVAGSQVVLRKAGDGHLAVEVAVSDEENRVTNTGNVEAIKSNLEDNGGNPYQYAMDTGETSGIGALTIAGGRVTLSAGDSGDVVNSGTITACLLYTSDAADE